MARPLKKKSDEAQDLYVKARIDGKTKSEAKEIAGYSQGTHARYIERPGSPIANKMQKALEARGIDEEYLAKNYEEGIAEARSAQGRVGDYNAYFKGLLQLSYLLGYGRKENPTVAIQLNDNRSISIDQGTIEGSLDRLQALTGILEGRTSEDQAGGIHEADSGAKDWSASPGVAEASGAEEESDS